MTIRANGARALVARTLRPAFAVAALATAVACSSEQILKVNRPDVIIPGALDNNAGATAQYAGVIGDMSNTMDNQIGIVPVIGLITDEIEFGATPPELRQLDQRATPESNTLIDVTFRGTQLTRGRADVVADALKAIKASDPRIGEMNGVSGLMQIFLAEMFCSGVPLSTPGVDGDPLTTTALLQSALAKLDLGKTNGAGDARVQNFIAVLRGRTLLDLGQFDAAGAAVASVPTSFTYTTFHDAGTVYQQNAWADYMQNFDGYLVSNNEGGNGLDFALAGDPRVPVSGDGSPSRFDAQTPRYYYDKATGFGAPTTVASGVEARLIEAEAALHASNTTAFIAKINEARANSGLAALSDPGSLNARVDLLFRERGFSLYLTGHRLGDLRRLVRQYGRGAETVYPSGAYHKDNLRFGTDVQFVIPQTERNNPKFQGCIDRNA